MKIARHAKLLKVGDIIHDMLHDDIHLGKVAVLPTYYNKEGFGVFRIDVESYVASHIVVRHHLVTLHETDSVMMVVNST